MKYTKKVALLVCISALMVGCSSAQKSSEVRAQRAPMAPYLKMNCKDLASEQNLLVREAEAAGAQVDSAYDSDKGAELVAWILFAPAAFLLEGNQDEAAKLGAIKGQLEAVREAQLVNKCVY